ncbi:hypothetical protein LNV23_03985 [Paucibacter sp. DJ1R-11]|uniref:hypothetical protein n=1 Tax=Paucibacter sp. DJ1R-11 TaxID=2893556 RepID=UPI0021E45C74|nr:hypothetical protein [Paucibacter sp. DJ1R-11]MCV2362608.1 hypothetical protein [Paucibacter sp. DJ1R-11]
MSFVKPLLSASVAFVVLGAQDAHAMDMPCEVADPLATSSYERIRGAMAAEDIADAHRYKLAFWDVYKYASKCQFVKKLAGELVRFKLSATDSMPLAVLVFNGGNGLAANCDTGFVSKKDRRPSITITDSVRDPGIFESRRLREVQMMDPRKITMNLSE